MALPLRGLGPRAGRSDKCQLHSCPEGHRRQTSLARFIPGYKKQLVNGFRQELVL
jgi:hypothetical protein